MSEARTPAAEYPPPRHALRDLGLWFEANAEPPRAGFAVAPELLGPAGSLDAGALAVLADVVAGGPALRAAMDATAREGTGSWIATADLSLHVKRPVRAGEVVATPRVHRAGKSTIVIEVEVSSGAEVVAFARVGFARLEARGAFQAQARDPARERVRWGAPGGGFAAPWREALGVRVLDAARGEIELLLSPYVGNSLGALQGGLSAALSAFAAESAGSAAHGQPVASLDLGLHFLALARVGPARARATIERSGRDTSLVRVELRDAGAADRLCTVASVLVGSLPG